MLVWNCTKLRHFTGLASFSPQQHFAKWCHVQILDFLQRFSPPSKFQIRKTFFKQLISEHSYVDMKTCFKWEHLHSFHLTTSKFHDAFILSRIHFYSKQYLWPFVFLVFFTDCCSLTTELGTRSNHCIILATCSAEATWPCCILFYHIHQKSQLVFQDSKNDFTYNFLSLKNKTQALICRKHRVETAKRHMQ